MRRTDARFGEAIPTGGRRGLLAAAAAGLCVLWLTVPLAAQADLPVGDFEIEIGPQHALWFLGGSIDEPVSEPGLDGTVTLDVVSDAKGRITGGGVVDFVLDGAVAGVPEVGDIDVFLPDVDVKGALRLRDGAGTLRMRLRMAGEAFADFVVVPVVAMYDFRGVVLGGVARGEGRAQVRAPGVRPVRGVVSLDVPLSSGPGDDGSWRLELTLASPDGRRLEGLATVRLSNPAAPPVLFLVKGRYDARRDVATLSLRGATRASRGASLRIKGLTWDGVSLTAGELSWRLLGQSGKARDLSGTQILP